MNLKSFWKENKNIIKFIILLFLVSRILLTLIGVYSKENFRNNNPNTFVWSYSDNKYLDIWGIWDTGYYLDIAKRGYQNDQNYEFDVQIPENSYASRQSNYGFLPLYPILIKITSLITGDFFLSGLLVSNTAFIFSGLILYKLAYKLYDYKTARRSVVFLFLYPSSFIYSGVFAESLTLLFILSSFYFALKKKSFLLSPIAAGLAGITKLVGLLSVFSLLKPQKGRKINIGYITLILTPLLFLLFYSIYQYMHSGDPFIYFNTQSKGWGARIANPIETIAVITLINNIPRELFVIKTITLSFILLEAILIYYSNKKMQLNYWFYWLVIMFAAVSSGVAQTISFPRHALLMIPHYFALSQLTANRTFLRIFVILFTTYQGLLMMLWVNGLSII